MEYLEVILRNTSKNGCAKAFCFAGESQTHVIFVLSCKLSTAGADSQADTYTTEDGVEYQRTPDGTYKHHTDLGGDSGDYVHYGRDGEVIETGNDWYDNLATGAVAEEDMTDYIPSKGIVKGGLKKLLKKSDNSIKPKKPGKYFDIQDGDDLSDLLKPGKYSSKSVKASKGKSRKFDSKERKEINEIGEDTGCHSCGSTDPGTKSGNFIPDHQPANSTISDGTEQRLYPHCKNCSNKQGGYLSGLKRKKK